MFQIMNRMKFYGVVRRTGSTLLALFIRCSSMAVWNQRFQQRYGKFGPPRDSKFFTWLLLQNRVWTVDRLMQREWPNQYFCPLCYRNLETTTDLMTECPVSCSIWEQIGSWYALPPLRAQKWFPNRVLSDWFNELSGPSCSAKVKGGMITDHSSLLVTLARAQCKDFFRDKRRIRLGWSEK
jgi:hypothetical protein